MKRIPLLLLYCFSVITHGFGQQGGTPPTSRDKRNADQSASRRTITGIITDTQDNPIPGAVVMLKDTVFGTISDTAGRFTLNTTGHEILKISTIGYQTQKINPDGQHCIQVKLEQSPKRFNDPVVTESCNKRLSNSGDTIVKWGGIRCIGSYPVTSPLLILDGKIYEGTLESIDPATIEHVSVLKDTTATAIYGTRGANGVIIIQSSAKKQHLRRH